jgi:hypothetical protein
MPVLEARSVAGVRGRRRDRETPAPLFKGTEVLIQGRLTHPARAA